jgi:uncharacterized protein (DUF952 family)
MQSPTPQFAYKVVSGPVWKASEAVGNLGLMPVDEADGFIHMSTAAQLRETLRLYFAGQTGLVLFAVEPARFGDALKWEPSRGGALFPHLYGELPMGAVAWSAEIDVAEDGSVDLPEAVR